MSKRVAIELQVVTGLGEVAPEAWGQLDGANHPFLSYPFLRGLEDTRCVNGQTGWQPVHHLFYQGDQLVAAIPLYLKSHSMGEFVFDHEWAHLAQNLGLEYYPKLLGAVPFSPVTGPRFLLRDSGDTHLLPTMARCLIDFCNRIPVSGVHINFCSQDLQGALEGQGFLPRKGVQYHWQNDGYESFEDYLRALKRKRRGEVRRELRRLCDLGIQFETLTGDALTAEHMDLAFDFYRRHVERYWGHQYLTRSFFHHLRETMASHLCLVLARDSERLLGMAFNLYSRTTLYGRYWGCEDLVPRFLHFATCYYQGIRFCIENKLKTFEPGAGGDFKQLRGFDPVYTYSSHYLQNERMHLIAQRYLQIETPMQEAHAAERMLHSQMKANCQSPSAGHSRKKAGDTGHC